MTPRALDALRNADTVCAEDTRVTGKLLAAFGIHARLERLDEASISSRASAVVERVLGGESIAYCSDAGMPGVSDPGQRLVAAARAGGAAVEVLPGPTAVATAYVASGFICPRFYFGGFFPRKEGDRESVLRGIESLDAVALFYESPRRVCAALHAVDRILPLRRVAVCRELTKLHEEVLVGSAREVSAVLDAREAAGGVKGEIVLVIDAPDKEESIERVADARAAAAVRAKELLADGSMTKKDAVKTLQKEFGLPRNDAYSLVHGS